LVSKKVQHSGDILEPQAIDVPLDTSFIWQKRMQLRGWTAGYSTLSCTWERGSVFKLESPVVSPRGAKTASDWKSLYIQRDLATRFDAKISGDQLTEYFKLCSPCLLHHQFSTKAANPSYIHYLTNLKFLQLQGHSGVHTAEMLEEIEKFFKNQSQCETLKITGFVTNFPTKTLQEILISTKYLTSLDLAYNSTLQDIESVVMAVSQCTSIKNLSFSNTFVGTEGIKLLLSSKLPSLRILDLTNTGIGRLFQYPQRRDSIGNSITDSIS
jgi:hypothetical protein